MSGIEISETLNSQDREQGSKRKKKNPFFIMCLSFALSKNIKTYLKQHWRSVSTAAPQVFLQLHCNHIDSLGRLLTASVSYKYGTVSPKIH